MTMPDSTSHADRFRCVVESDPTLPDWAREVLLATYSEIQRANDESRVRRSLVENDPHLDRPAQRMLSVMHRELTRPTPQPRPVIVQGEG